MEGVDKISVSALTWQLQGCEPMRRAFATVVNTCGAFRLAMMLSLQACTQVANCILHKTVFAQEKIALVCFTLHTGQLDMLTTAIHWQHNSQCTCN